MPIFVTVVKTGAGGAKNLADLGKSYEEGMKMAEKMGIKPIAQYGLLGPYDFMFIYEAADEKAAASSSLFQSAKWGGEMETWTAIPLEEFAKLTARLKG
jgi:uncharacterized protein with GYD domain